MLDAPTDAFLDWWFVPWADLPASAPTDGMLAARDRYRHWCDQAGLAPHIAEQADWRWQPAAVRDADELMQAAELFGGLLAARARRQAELAALSPARRRWCLSVALTQPLASWMGELPEPMSLGRRGLLELGARLELAFPGMWPRLRLLLPAAEQQALSRFTKAPAAPPRLHDRDRRCWLMCLAQVRAERVLAAMTTTESR
ncbi:hypothetical protein [Herbaspirillum sp. YR522]|uniref:hypothetical protein n=1 Tax=Herbaspirillum sp. YR522 TaxID=1144342 RepID=UPI00026F99EE|nr:hypothetical protein [Herbaspirillum sp. YR522]EJN02937.1 hypothetical protein PMI40_02890 [Herbaspirillum sp. YR522]